MPTDQELLAAMYPSVEKSVRKGMSPQDLARVYEGGGLQQPNPLLDPVDIASTVGAGALMKAASSMGERAILERVSNEPGDPLGFVNHVLKNYSWEKLPRLSRAARTELETAAKGGSTAAARILAKNENNMFRGNNMEKLYAALIDVDETVPHRASFYKAQLQNITKRMKDANALLGDEHWQTGKQLSEMPADIVADAKKLLETYKKDLIKAGVTQPLMSP